MMPRAKKSAVRDDIDDRRGRSRVLVLAAGDAASTSGQRAHLLFAGLDCRTSYQYRSGSKLGSFVRFVRTALRERPSIVYVIDTVWSSVIASLIAKVLLGCRFVLDTGDAAYALSRSIGRRNHLGSLAVWLMEWAALHAADDVVVRGRYHRLYLRDRGLGSVIEIPDCLPLDRPSEAALNNSARALRASIGLSDTLTVGLVGRFQWSPRLRTTYGWDLVEAMRFLEGLPIHAVLIGEGDGLNHLRRRIEELGLNRRFTILGAVGPDRIDEYVRIIDVCLSTQSDDLVGWVRTTSKLPLYLVNNRFVLATDVGQASWVLPPEMRLSYHGVVDREYPMRLAARLEQIARDRTVLHLRFQGQEIVRRHFDARSLRSRLATHLGLDIKPSSSKTSSAAASPALAVHG